MVSSAIVVALANGPGGAGPPGIARGDQPIPLMPALNTPVIVRVLFELENAGVTRAVLLVDVSIAPQVSAAIAEVGRGSISVSLLERGPLSPLLRAIGEARRLLEPGPFLLRFADGLCSEDLASQVESGTDLGASDAIVLTAEIEDEDVEREEEMAMPDVVDELVTPSHPVEGEFNVGMYVLGSAFPDELTGSEALRATSVLGTQIVDTAIEQMWRDGGRVERRHARGWWRYRGQEQPILAINHFMLATATEWGQGGEMIDSELRGPVRCEADARIESAVIRGPVVIGFGAELSHVYLGPFTTIGPRVKIEGAELENSVVLEGSSISHPHVRFDSSVIGPRARLFRDFRLPRATRVHVGPGSSIALQ